MPEPSAPLKRMPPRPRVILIAGPTASGKSALALALARRLGGAVVNADSMQVYREAPIVTAHPTAAEQAAVPHRLYGHVRGEEAYSVGRYLEDVRAVLADLDAVGMVAIVTGGTGLYFKALLEGLSPVPAIPAEVRARCRLLAEAEGLPALRRAVASVDPVLAARVDPDDAQRLVRALEVFEATGRPLSDWQRLPGVPVIDGTATLKLVVDRPRVELQARADARFEAMMEAGALDEMRALASLRLSPDLPLMRALGVRPLLAHLAGHLSETEAVAAGKQETRHYIKRQQTWIKRHMIAWMHTTKQEMENMGGIVESIVKNAH